MTTLVGPLPQAGGTATIQKKDGTLEKGTYAGGNGGITTSSGTHHPPATK
jgi:hypothetical protein